MKKEYYLEGATNRATSVSAPKEPLRRFAKNIVSAHLKREKEFCVPSNEFFAAWQRFANADDGELRISVIGDSQMKDDLRTGEESEIPNQTYYFELQDLEGNTMTGVGTGTVGDEFMKTKDYGIAKKERAIEVIEGQGIILVQENVTDSSQEIIPTLVERFQVIQAKQGQRIFVPKGSIYAFVNPDIECVFVVKHSGRTNNESANNPSNQSLIGMRGLAFHVTDLIGRSVLERNPNYKEVRDIDLGGITVLPYPKNNKAKLSGWSQD